MMYPYFVKDKTIYYVHAVVANIEYQNIIHRTIRMKRRSILYLKTPLKFTWLCSSILFFEATGIQFEASWISMIALITFFFFFGGGGGINIKTLFLIIERLALQIAPHRILSFI